MYESIEDKLRHSVHSRAWGSVMDSTWISIENSVRTSVLGSVLGRVGISVRDELLEYDLSGENT